MNELLITAENVLIMLAYAVPGFIFVKTKMVDQSHIASFAKLLLYVCSPALSVYSFNSVDYSDELLFKILLFLLLSFLLQTAVLCLVWLFLRKKSKDPKYRVSIVAGVLGNVGFFGLPLLLALLPDNPEVKVYSAVFIVGMNILSWTVGSMFLTGDKNYMSFKKIIFNPPVLVLCITLPLFLFKIKLTGTLEESVTILGRMSTPLCMLILGMRLATVKLKEMFKDTAAYTSTVIKLLVFPLISFLVISVLPDYPFDQGFKAAFFILCCCPTASVVLNLSEVLGAGQKAAADAVLVSTLLCVFTIPLMALLI